MNSLKCLFKSFSLVFCLAFAMLSMFTVNLTKANYSSVKKTDTKISAPPVIVREVKTESDLEKVSENGVQVALLNINEAAEVVLGGKTISVISAHNTIKGKAIPAFIITNEQQSIALTQLLNSFTFTNKIYDLFFVSSNAELLKTAKSQYNLARGILDYSAKDFSHPFEISSQTFKSNSSIAIVSADKLTKEHVEYLNAAYMSVWAKSSADTAFDIMSEVSTGINGIVSQYNMQVIDCLSKINDINTLTRKTVVVGHRGASLDDIADPNTSYALPENTMAAFKYAYENSAAVIELDVMLSSDKELIIFHDDTINRLLKVPQSSPDLYVSNLTKAQIQSYGFNGTNDEYKDERVPVLQDVLSFFKGKNLRILIEIKADQEGLAKLSADAVKALEMQNQVSFLSFYKNQLKIIKDELPEVAAGILTFTPLEKIDDKIDVKNNLASINNLTDGGKYAYAPNTGLYNGSLFVQQNIRAIAFNGWTYVNAKTRNDHIGYGVNAITLDVPQWFNEKVAKLDVANSKIDVFVGEEVNLNITPISYKGNTLQPVPTRFMPVIISGDAVQVENGIITAKKEGTAVVVPRYQQAGYAVMGSPVEITVKPLASKPKDNKTLLFVGIGAAVLLGASATIIIAKNKKVKRK